MVPVSLVEPAVRSYIVYSGILALKVLGMAVLTARARFRKNVFANPEDAKKSKGAVKFDDPDVERVRRAHLNDLENIPVFWLLGAMYLTTGPSAELATLLFRVFTASRIIHTIVYAVKPLPQPARAIAYGIPYLINWFMGGNESDYSRQGRLAWQRILGTSKPRRAHVSPQLELKTEKNMVPVSIAEPAVRSYIIYSSVLALKVLGMALLTGMVRHKKKVFANEEDAKPIKGVVKYDDPDVERVRRAHLNDLENIPAFWVLGALYLTTGPPTELATLLFRVFTAGRILHTFVYAVKPLPQPARAIAFGISYLINTFMGLRIASYYLSAL